MKLIILHLNTANKPSPISEGVIDIRINCQPCQGINLTTRHMHVGRAPQVATIHHAVKETGRVLPLPSAVFHAYASADTSWVAWHYPFYTSISEVRYRPTHRHTKLLSLGNPYVPCLFNRAQLMWALIDIGRGCHLGALKFRSDWLPSFPSSILCFPLIASPGLQLCQHYRSSCYIHIGPPSIEKVLSRADSNHLSSTDSLHN
jgi:hypothetical protein